MPHPGSALGGRYRLDERIGAGGMGEVWRATDEVLGRTVAVKVVLPSLLGEPDFVRRFLAEARAMASVNHPGVVAIHDYRSDPTGAFLVMEYVEGEALSSTLGRLGRLTPVATMDLIAQAADALQAAHDRGIVHRDVKPANLLVRTDGTLVLTDFGIARARADAPLTTAGAILGTPSYLAPEQVLGHPATARSDVYSLGVVAYECLAGHRPFGGESPYAIAVQRVHEPPRTMAGDVPRPVLAIVERALAVDPSQRWPSAADLGTAARRALAGLPPDPGTPATPNTQATPATRAARQAGRQTPRPASRRARRRLVAVAAAVLGVALVAVGITIAANGPGNAGAQRDTPSAQGAALAGFVACGADVFCPPAPMCWDGLTVTGGMGTGHEPSPLDCTEPHYWETFAVGRLSSGAQFVRQDELINRTEIARVCSQQVLADRSRDPASTAAWSREPWPVQVDETTWIFHCMGGLGVGETTGAAFHA
jgi:hypothetical protein